MSIFAATLLIFCSRACLAGGGPKNVVVVINDNSPVSQAIGRYYQQKRGIPDCNICRIQCSTAEEVSRTECETRIVAPIRAFLADYLLPSRIDYIVLTKGIPLRATYSYAYFNGPVSVASILTCVGEPAIAYPLPDPSDPTNRPPLANPYGPLASPAAPAQYFTHQTSFAGHSFYAVTRLDAYSEADVYRMIDDALVAQPAKGLFLIDGCDSRDYPHITQRLGQANDALIAAGCQTYYSSADYYAKLREFVGGQRGVMGYFSWGSNEVYSDPNASFSQAKYVSNHFLPGSIADTFVSYSARTFTYPPTAGGSLIADLVPQGLSGGNGYVSEPNVNLTTYPNVLFDRYLKGYNLAESFMAATPELYWKAVTIGDPLMAPYATPPVVAFTSPHAGMPVHGTIHVSADATDASGIAKVEFYVNDEPVAVCSSAPYGFEWDTGGCPDGTYVIEAIAYENSPVYTQSLSRLDIIVSNAPQCVPLIGDLNAVEDGVLVNLTSKVVTAGADSLDDCIYISEPDRSAGLKIIGATNVYTGSLVDVTGETITVDGQKVVTAASVTSRGAAQVPVPIGLTTHDVGTGDYYSGPGSSSLAPGLSNTGLLIRCWGQVQQVGVDAFYITDRSIKQPTGAVGRLKVSIAGMNRTPYIPAVGTYVQVTGISAMEPNGGDLKPILRLRTPSDVVYNLPFAQVSSPAGTAMSGWNLLSMPGVPVNPAAASVLTGLDLDGDLSCWDAMTQSTVVYDSTQAGAFPPLVAGTGFWLQLAKPYTIATRLLLDKPDTDAWISLPVAGSNLIGHPFMTPRKLNGCHVSDGVEVLTMDEAAMAGWIDWALYYWDNAGSTLASIDMSFDDAAALEPWKGYWVTSSRPNLALIVPRNPD